MLGTKENNVVTGFTLEFLNIVIPMFENFLMLFQKYCTIVYILCDSMHGILVKLLGRHMKPQAVENKDTSDLTYVACTNLSLQLSNEDIVIEESTRKALSGLTLA